MSTGSSPTLPNRMTSLPPAVYTQTYGGALHANEVMLVLYGLATLQVFIYLLHSTYDTPRLKSLAWALWITGTIHAILGCYSVYHYMVLSYTKPLYILQGESSLFASVCIGVAVCFVTQVYFARTFYLRRPEGRLWAGLTAILWFLIVSQIALGTFVSYKLFMRWDLRALSTITYSAMMPLLLVRFVTNTIITVMASMNLSRPQPSPHRLVVYLTYLVTYLVNGFGLCLLTVLVQLIILVIKPNDVWALFMECVNVQLYINSLLAVLNSRAVLREMGAVPGTLRLHRRNIAEDSIVIQDLTASNTRVNLGFKNRGIMITTESIVKSDFDQA